MIQQLVLNFPHRAALGRDNFFVTPCNDEAISLIDAWPNWTDPVQAIYGPPASGKSHLAAVWRARCGAHAIMASDLKDTRFEEILHRNILSPNGLIIDCLENGIEDEGTKVIQANLFHLINQARCDNLPLLLLSAVPFAGLPVALPDLRSRFMGMAITTLHAPDDALIVAILRKLFADRQLSVSDAVIGYVLARIERDFGVLVKFVSALDHYSITSKRPITVPFVATIMKAQGGEGEVVIS